VIAGPYAWLVAYFAVLAVFSQVDVLLLKALSDERTLAAYGSALRYYALLSLALGAVHAVLLPAIQRAASQAELDTLYAQHFRLLALFVPAVALAALAAGWILPWIDLGRYPDAVPAFRILAASAVISFAFSPHVNVLLKRERFRFLFLLIVAALAVDIVLNLALIPRFGAAGAAAATLLASACVTVPIFLASRRARPLPA
jgi:O-antigen/teichoic acid export membrane protein